MFIDIAKKMLAEQLCAEPSEITDDARLVEDLGADSIDLVQLLIRLEKELDISFTDEEIQEFKTVGDVAKCLARKERK